MTAGRADLWPRAYRAIAKSLVEFGYPDCTAKMVKDTHAALLTGKRGADLPHGIVGRFAERQILDNPEIFGVVS